MDFTMERLFQALDEIEDVFLTAGQLCLMWLDRARMPSVLSAATTGLLSRPIERLAKRGGRRSVRPRRALRRRMAA
jgi:hypothetical protein